MSSQAIFTDLQDLENAINSIDAGSPPSKELITKLAHTSAYSDDKELATECQDQIRELAVKNGITISSINNLYMAFSKGEFKNFTVPAMNIRALTFDTAHRVFNLAQKHNIGALVFELAISEQGYTDQPPSEYSASVIGGALMSGYKGHVFVQGDHYQFNSTKFQENRNAEIERIKESVKRSIDAGFLNIDIDGSTLVDLDKEDLSEQQRNNYEVTAEITSYIREIEPQGVTVSVGGEIGHIGGKNSTAEDFIAFMDGYNTLIEQKNLIGISKVSVQTGTSHGGVTLPDGTLADIELDFNVLSSIAEVARKKYQIGGPVQHGASTLPDDLFHKFPENGAIEVHLATGFQNIIFEHLNNELKEEIYSWMRSNLAEEKDPKWTDEQFIYKLRKKAMGPFKKNLWTLPDDEKAAILDNLERKFEFLFKELNVFDTKTIVEERV